MKIKILPGWKERREFWANIGCFRHTSRQVHLESGKSCWLTLRRTQHWPPKLLFHCSRPTSLECHLTACCRTGIDYWCWLAYILNINRHRCLLVAVQCTRKASKPLQDAEKPSCLSFEMLFLILLVSSRFTVFVEWIYFLLTQTIYYYINVSRVWIIHSLQKTLLKRYKDDIFV